MNKGEREQRVWRCRERAISLGKKTLVMGILNVTPDSFSDGGEFFSPNQAVERAWEIAREGADLLDIGGMSSRPGSEEISETEELDRVLPIIEQLGENYPLPISVDTYRVRVAEAALQQGASIINDITALRGDPGLAETVAGFGAGLILMHMRGTPRTMQQNVDYQDLIDEVTGFLVGQKKYAVSQGVAEERILFDPGIGFGKSLSGNLELIRALGRLRDLATGVLVGPSRKSFIGKLLDCDPKDRIWGTTAAIALSIQSGADIVRIHDVKAMSEVCKVADAIVRGI